jgi:hypothetical protein
MSQAPPANPPSLCLLMESRPGEPPPEHFRRVRRAAFEKAEVAYLQARRRRFRDFVVLALVFDPLVEEGLIDDIGDELPGVRGRLEEARRRGCALVVITIEGRDTLTDLLTPADLGEGPARMLRGPAGRGRFVFLVRSHHGFHGFRCYVPAE